MVVVGGDREKNHNFVGTRVWGGDAVCWKKTLNFCVALSPPLREKDDKYKTWMPKFLMAKEDKDQRKSSDDVERSWFSFCVFPCCLTSYAHLLSRLQERDAPDCTNILCLAAAPGSFPFEPRFQEILQKMSWGQNKLLDLSCMQAGYALRVSPWSCIMSSHLAETKRGYLLYIWLLFCTGQSHSFFNCTLNKYLISVDQLLLLCQEHCV